MHPHPSPVGSETSGHRDQTLFIRGGGGSFGSETDTPQTNILTQTSAQGKSNVIKRPLCGTPPDPPPPPFGINSSSTKPVRDSHTATKHTGVPLPPRDEHRGAHVRPTGHGRHRSPPARRSPRTPECPRRRRAPVLCRTLGPGLGGRTTGAGGRAVGGGRGFVCKREGGGLCI